MLVAVVLGGIVTGSFLHLLRKRLGVDIATIDENPQLSKVPRSLVGIIERLFFAIAVAFNLSGIIIGMIGWITVKMVSNWNRPELGNHPTGAFTALLGNMVSMLFAMVGGLICAGRIWP